MVFMPPRHFKSETISRLFSAYYLLQYPYRWVGLTAYGADLAYSLSRDPRTNYQAGGGELRQAKAMRQWETYGGGGMWAAGVGGAATGKGFDLGIIDDPLRTRRRPPQRRSAPSKRIGIAAFSPHARRPTRRLLSSRPGGMNPISQAGYWPKNMRSRKAGISSAWRRSSR